MDVDPRFLDVDFTKETPYVFGDRGARCFGDLPTYEQAEEPIPRDQWEAISEKTEAEKAGLEWLITRIMNQKQEGSCVANQTTQALELLQGRTFGKNVVVPLSAISLYKRIGRSPNSGAMIDDGAEEATKVGILPLDTPANRERFGDAVMPHTGFYEKFPANWQETAKRFRFHEVSIARTFEGLISALLRGHPVGVGRQGHSILYVRATFKNGRANVLYPNSWSLDWGQAAGEFKGGFGFDSESQIKQSASYAIVYRSIVVPTEHANAA